MLTEYNNMEHILARVKHARENATLLDIPSLITRSPPTAHLILPYAVLGSDEDAYSGCKVIRTLADNLSWASIMALRVSFELAKGGKEA